MDGGRDGRRDGGREGMSKARQNGGRRRDRGRRGESNLMNEREEEERLMSEKV